MKRRCRCCLSLAVLMLAPFYAAGEAPPDAAPPPGWGPEQWQVTKGAIERLADDVRQRERFSLNGRDMQTLEKQNPFLVMTCATPLEAADSEPVRDLYCYLLSLILENSKDVAVRQEAVERLLHVQVCNLLAGGAIRYLSQDLTAADFNDRAKAYLRADAYQPGPDTRVLIKFCGIANLQDLRPVLRRYVPPDFEPFVEPAADCVAESLVLARLGDARELDRWIKAFDALPVGWGHIRELPDLSYIRSPRAVPILARWVASDARSPYQEHAPKGVPLWPRALYALAATVADLPVPGGADWDDYSDDERAKVLEWLKTQAVFKMKP